MKEYRPDAVINIEGRQYLLFKRGHGKDGNYPYMIDCEDGRIPYRSQRPLLRQYLIQKGIDVNSFSTTPIHT